MSHAVVLSPSSVSIGRPHQNVHCYIVSPGSLAAGAGHAGGNSVAKGAVNDGVNGSVNGGVSSGDGVCLLPVGVPGELLIAGPCLARGYCGRPDLTAAAFVPNPCLPLAECLLPEGLRGHFARAYRTGGGERLL